MKNFIVGALAAASFGLVASVAQADCAAHSVTASSPAKETVAMSTYDGAVQAPAEAVEVGAQANAPACAEGDKDCAPAKK